MADKKQKILTDEERDSFRGTTIEENGSSHTFEDEERGYFRDRRETDRGFHGFSVRTSGCSVILITFFVMMAVLSFLFKPLMILFGISIIVYFISGLLR